MPGAPSLDPADVLGRLRELQAQVTRLVTEVDDPPPPVSEPVPGAGTRIVIMPTPPGRPELPPRRAAPSVPVVAAEPERSGPPRRSGTVDRRVGPVHVRAPAQERRSGRRDRRLGHDRRSPDQRAPRPRPAWRGHVGVLVLVVLQVAGLGAAVVALVQPG